MRIRKNNLLFLTLVLTVTAAQFLPRTILPEETEYLPEYLLCLVAGLILLRLDGTAFNAVLPYNVGIKPVTALLTAALAFLTMPLNAGLTQLGGLIGGDILTVLDESSQGTTLPGLIFSVAVIPAVFEEMYFRGFFYAGFSRARGQRSAILLSTVLFAVFHCNIQQILYAFALGMLIAVLREMTGGMWAGMLYHLINNLWFVFGMTAKEDSFFLKLPMEQLGFGRDAGHDVYTAIMIAVCMALAAGVLLLIAEREGKRDELKRFFGTEPGADKPDGRKEPVVTAPLVLGCAVLVAMTVLATVILRDPQALPARIN